MRQQTTKETWEEHGGTQGTMIQHESADKRAVRTEGGGGT